ncbi:MULTISPECIES: threonine synthase [unclassified Campylobacter]|uniref:threonine synthase n=1 Tax=unclassified Campylobacter TaxID=2593542 RepID=UPI0012382058|nr:MULTISPECIES: threonine synthase [unclassified Campylobacter]KAA6225289.1 threonine synthase [Campylobacter sp. LR286c]KAA6230414.1 threonine synthase [Campylobacter sp. LR291e]
MLLVESRNSQNQVSFKEALINPNAKSGGLYTPLSLPKFKGEDYANLSYADFAFKLIQSFDFGHDELFKKALKAYECFDDSTCPINLSQIDEKCFINELYHGPTRAFKDMALVPFGILLNEFSKDKKILIICATSGDTGPATLKSFENSKNIKVVCMYPNDATSKVQALQMRALDKVNLKVYAINGDFDDAQRILKNFLAKDDFKSYLTDLGYELCAANSINFGRILFQIIYHYYAALKVNEKTGENVEIIIPSGNFGNALGAYYAKKMGAPISLIKIASNANNILSELFNKGVYDLRGKSLKKTISPAMDILISSNIERLLFDKFGDKRTNELMLSLKNERHFSLTNDELKNLQNEFKADFSTDLECMEVINSNFSLIDPHTATCFKLLNKNEASIITSTAEWTKFTPSMIKALFDRESVDERADLMELAKKFNVKVKDEILKLFELENQKYEVYEIENLENEIKRWIKQ